MENKLVSVIIPIYNVEKFLYKTVRSVINQDYKKIEIILVDDGSPDGSAKIMDKLAKTDGRIICIHKENGGHGDAINDGIKVAKGKYFKIVDSDDWVDLDALNKILKSIQEEKELPDLYILNYVY